MTADLVTSNFLAIELPDESNSGWTGLVWLLLALIPISVGGAILRPAINSLITKRVEPEEVGGTLGISSSFVSAANVIGPIAGGLLWVVLGRSAPFFIDAFAGRLLRRCLSFAGRLVNFFCRSGLLKRLLRFF